ncbi:MAG TPA: hypothetical protein VE967_10110, partial [Gemmatimonadaceae bacterium]|nr:hypothetical protein [Gemmatimonadaceae bacterium]
NALEFSGPVPYDTVHLATAATRVVAEGRTRRRHVTTLGLTLGRGRIAIVSDPHFLTNDVIRQCHYGAGIAAVRALEWLVASDSGVPRRTVMFDEYHQGYGHHASAMRAVGTWLVRTASGRTMLQVLVAALVLLMAVAARPIAPVAKTVIQRRSPLEHVGALAYAYERVRATRTAAHLLLQGLRRRAGRTVAARGATDEQFLDALVLRRPAAQADAARLRAALSTPIPAAELGELATTIDRIERSIRS